MKVVAVILTLNEAAHLERCIESLKSVATEIVVADCFSTDATLDIGRAHGAKVIQRAWVNHSSQFNWALTELPSDTEWVLRIDADEYLTPELAEELRLKLPGMPAEVAGVYCGRRMAFEGKLIRYGGLFPIRVLRLFRYGKGRCEDRWMDEHITVQGQTAEFRGEIIDDSRDSLNWWTNKHNRYASLEAVELLNLDYGFLSRDRGAGLHQGTQAGMKRWIKERIYARTPGGLRALAYFCYRYFLRLGFLDGRAGADFHILQGFWYRYLVDAKVAEVNRYVRENRCDIKEAIEAVLDVRV